MCRDTKKQQPTLQNHTVVVSQYMKFSHENFEQYSKISAESSNAMKQIAPNSTAEEKQLYFDGLNSSTRAPLGVYQS